jgi:hypothetical protein
MIARIARTPSTTGARAEVPAVEAAAPGSTDV